MIADQYGVFHGSAGNHARLDDHGFENEECKDDPEPGEQFAANQLLAGKLRFLGFLVFLLRFRARFGLRGGHSSADLKTVKDAVPADFARMDENAEISFHPLAYVAWLPNAFRRADGHEDEKRRGNDVSARNKSPVAAVVGIAAIVTHHKVFVWWDDQGSVMNVLRKRGSPVRREAVVNAVA